MKLKPLKLPATIEVGQIIGFGKYNLSVNNPGKTSVIRWQVLAKEENRILLVSKYAIDCLPYNETFSEVTWETCTIRSWLNNTFINSSFTNAERAVIQTVTVEADNDPKYSTISENDTQDKVFLLSISEVNKYFSSADDRKCYLTTYANERGAWKFPDGTCLWFLRSPGNLYKSAAVVYNDGSVNYAGQCVSDRTYGIRPAMWIELDS